MRRAAWNKTWQWSTSSTKVNSSAVCIRRRGMLLTMCNTFLHLLRFSSYVWNGGTASGIWSSFYAFSGRICFKMLNEIVPNEAVRNPFIAYISSIARSSSKQLKIRSLTSLARFLVHIRSIRSIWTQKYLANFTKYLTRTVTSGWSVSTANELFQGL